MMKSVSVLNTFAKLSKPTFAAPKRNITNLAKKNIASVATTKTNVAQFLRFQTFGVRTFVEQQNRERRPRAPRPINENNTNLYYIVEGNRQNHDEILNELQSMANNLGVADNYSTVKSHDGNTYAFFAFSSAQDAASATEQLRGIARENKLKTRLSSSEEVQLVQEQIKKPSTVVILNKIPFSSTETEIREFLHDYKIVDISVGHGKAYVQFSTLDEAKKCINEKQGITYGRVPIYVTNTIGVELINHRSRPINMVRVGNIAWGTEEGAVEAFFRESGLDVSRVIPIRENRNGNSVLSSVFVEFTNPEEAFKAISKDKENLGERPVRVTLSSGKEVSLARDRAQRKEAEGNNGFERRERGERQERGGERQERGERRERRDFGERRQQRERRPRRDEDDE